MSNQTSIYNEKKLAYYEATYKLSVLAKPQDVNLTLTAAHIYGLGYIMEQNGTKEGDPVYTRFSCGLDEITKVYINENSRQSPLYIQCDTMNKGVLFRRRIIIPCLKNASSIVDEILSVKKQYDEKMEKSKERARAMNRRAAEESVREEEVQPAAEQSVEEAAKKKSFDDKLKDFERMKKLSDSFFDNIPIPGKHHSSKAEAAELPAEEKPAEAPAAEVSKEEAPIAAEAPAAAPVPEAAAPVKETAKKKPDIKVTIDDLLQLNDSIDEDFLKNTEPPITGGKKNADKYLDDIGSDYKYNPVHKDSERDALLTEELGEVKLEDMNDYTPGRTDVLDFSDLEGVNKNDLISDMTGAKVDIEGETTPVERMDFVRKSHKNNPVIENIKVVIDEKPAEAPAAEAVPEVPAAEAVPETPAAETAADDVPVLKKLPEVVLEDIAAPLAAEDAYIEDATTADTETIAAENTDDAEVPEVKNVHIDFSTEVTHDTSLDDFQESVKKLKAMLDSDLITKEEFMAEKKKLLSTLY
ncbi:MAG: SHOCT domain-containing protein [Oscillospiraceae bacterium]|nr:SHOCT domain-containing protein [Oscillospiraceae bacterium]